MTQQTAYHLVLTHEEHNTLVLLVSIFLLVLFIRAVDRFYNVCLLRAAVLTHKAVEIRGFGENILFLSNPSAQHISGIVHNRQSEPAEAMQVMMVPIKVSRLTLQPSALKITLWNYYKGHGFFLYGVDKSMLIKFEQDSLIRILQDRSGRLFSSEDNVSVAVVSNAHNIPCNSR